MTVKQSDALAPVELRVRLEGMQNVFALLREIAVDVLICGGTELPCLDNNHWHLKGLKPCQRVN